MTLLHHKIVLALVAFSSDLPTKIRSFDDINIFHSLIDVRMLQLLKVILQGSSLIF